MTEHQIERQVEAMTDSLDRRFMRTAMTNEQYALALAEIAAWADAQYAKRFVIHSA